MAKNYSAHQQRIIRNYYRNLDGIRAQRLQELVTELWLAETDKKRERLWARAEELLAKGDAPPAEVAGILAAPRRRGPGPPGRPRGVVPRTEPGAPQGTTRTRRAFPSHGARDMRGERPPPMARPLRRPWHRTRDFRKRKTLLPALRG